MSYPSDQNLLRSLIEAATGSQSETYVVPTSPFKHVLGSSLSPAMPSGWPLKIGGAAPLSAPNAPTAGSPATTTATGHFLASTGTYQWKLTATTQFGETTPSSAFAPGALGAGVTGYNLAIPAVTEGTADAPVLYRRLYRTTNGGSTFYWVADIDLTTTSYLDGKPDGDLEVAAPGTNTSGSTGAVTLTVNGTAGTEMPPGTTLATNQFIVDYSLSNTAGTITHYSGDSGKTIVATYVAANLLSAALLSAIITAIKSVVTAFGTPGAANGTPTLNGSSQVVQPSAVNPATTGQASGVAGLDANTNLVIPAGHKLSAPGQTGGVANQAVGIAHIADGTADGATTTVATTLVTANSTILLTPASTLGTCSGVTELKGSRVAGTSFTIQNKGAVGSTGGYGLDVAYLIIN